MVVNSTLKVRGIIPEHHKNTAAAKGAENTSDPLLKFRVFRAFEGENSRQGRQVRS